jgi:hypothetical protein
LIRNFRGIRDEVLSDQLSDYRVDDPYIQAHLHGPSSRLVLDLDDSPNVLRDEAVLETAALLEARSSKRCPFDRPVELVGYLA